MKLASGVSPNIESLFCTHSLSVPRVSKENISHVLSEILQSISVKCPNTGFNFDVRLPCYVSESDARADPFAPSSFSRNKFFVLFRFRSAFKFVNFQRATAGEHCLTNHLTWYHAARYLHPSHTGYPYNSDNWK